MSNQVYEAIARSLREFGYADVTAEMVRETDDARRAGKPQDEPHGIVSMFARRQLDEISEAGLLPGSFTGDKT